MYCTKAGLLSAFFYSIHSGFWCYIVGSMVRPFTVSARVIAEIANKPLSVATLVTSSMPCLARLQIKRRGEGWLTS